MSKKLPGHYVKPFTVQAETVGKPATDDGRPVNRWEVDTLLDKITYTGALQRLDGRWALVVEWVDMERSGHRIALPHELVERVLTLADRIKGEARSDRAKAAAETRRERQEEAAAE